VVAEVLVSATEEPVKVLGLELASIALAVLVTSSVIRDSETNWLEGASLLLAYSVLGVEFLFF
jgi:Ca2+/H+ antiporter